jgi:pimeloyl-ACP methyl ester carboxylesterase
MTAPPAPAELRSWAALGHHRTVHGRRLFVVDEGPRAAPALVVLHGFPTCSLDFEAALPLLSTDRRVVLHDHLGFGLSEKPAGVAYSLMEQAEMALGLWTQLGLTEVDLLAHDYGTSVATEILARRERGGLPVRLRSVTLGNGSMRIDLAKLTWPQLVLRDRTLGPLFARLATRRLYGWRLRKTLATPGALSDADLDRLWAAGRYADGHLRLPQISQYLHERVRFVDRWLGALSRLNIPAHILWGQADPIAVPAIAEAVASITPGSRLQWLPGLGHYPMVEDPTAWTAAVTTFLGEVAANAPKRRSGEHAIPPPIPRQ